MSDIKSPKQVANGTKQNLASKATSKLKSDLKKQTG
jgi:hypothetical protein